MVVTNALRVGVLSVAELLESATDSDGQSKGLTETTARTDEQMKQMKNCQEWLSAYPWGD